MTGLLQLFVLLVLWGLFNWLAPLAMLHFAERLSIGRVPGDILVRGKAHHVRFYVSGALGSRGCACSVWSGPFHAVIVSRAFLQAASADQIRFTLAHELGHCAMGHLRLRWLLVTTGLILLPFGRRMLERTESAADAYAESLVCIPRSVLRAPPPATPGVAYSQFGPAPFQRRPVAAILNPLLPSSGSVW